MSEELKNIIQQEDPIDRVLETKTLLNGLELIKTTVPLGVVGIIYEARPNVTVDVFALCFKARNVSVLKGGSEAFHSNTAFVRLIKKSIKKYKIDPHIIHLLSNDKKEVALMLKAYRYIDVIIPRGGKNLIDFVRKNSRIPVIETGAGVVHTYFDESADIEMGNKIIVNAKTRRPAVCNALDTLLIHEQRLHDLPVLISGLEEKNVTIYADRKAFQVLKGQYNPLLLKHAALSNFGKEYLSLKLSLKTVGSLREALDHIAHYGSKHSEAIISKSSENIDIFLNDVDAAVVYANASTAFTDGGQFGFGAEIGISTQKLHARGPMGLQEITSYKWIVKGNGQMRIP